jgi:PST family polysaccharide transporter/lipopolysaccharide exporter
LGEKWNDIEPLMGWLALSTGLLGLSSGAYTTFDAIGKPQLGARMQWLRLVILVLAIAPVAILTHELVAIAITRLIVTAVFMPSLFFAVGSAIGVSPRDYLRALWRPFAAASVMACIVAEANHLLVIQGVLRLLLDVVLGGTSFVLASLVFWIWSGRPPSAERDFVDFVEARLKSFRAHAKSESFHSTIADQK